MFKLQCSLGSLIYKYTFSKLHMMEFVIHPLINPQVTKTNVKPFGMEFSVVGLSKVSQWASQVRAQKIR